MRLYEELRRRNVIRVATAYVIGAWLAIQVVETVLPAFGFTDRAVRLVVILLGIGFVPAVIGAWIFQVTPEGLVRDRGSESGRGSPAVSRNLDRAIIVLLALGISYFAFDKFVLAPERAAQREAEIAEQARTEGRLGFYGDRSIAVLPFDNMSPDPDQQYFVDGVAEEVLNLLARIRDLRVISRSSSFTFRDSDMEIPEIAERLDVGYVLEGSVRRAGDRVRVTAQLIEGDTDTHLWSHTYEESLDDVFRIQDKIAADVVENLKLAISGPLPRSRPVDPEAMALTQQGSQLLQLRPEGYGQKAYLLLTRALDIDPDYVPALEALITANFVRVGEGHISWSEQKALETGLLQRIRTLDPDSTAPDVTEAYYLAQDGYYEAAAVSYLSALAKDLSKAEPMRLAGRFARRIGKFDVSRRVLTHALAVDPLCHQCRRRLAEALFYTREYERAEQQYEQFRLSADDAGPEYFDLLLLRGKPDRVLELTENAEDEARGWTGMYTLTARAMAKYSEGDEARAEALLADLEASDFPDERARKYLLAKAAAWMDRKDLAFENLFELADTDMDYVRRRVHSPVWDNLRDDPRWREWREAAGVSQARFEAIGFDPVMPE